MAALYWLLSLLFAHLLVGTAIMVHFMRREDFKAYWQTLPMRDFLNLWICFAMGWSWATVLMVSGRKDVG